MNKGICVLLTMTILSGIVLMSNTTSATKSVSNASVTVPEACTMTGSGMNSHTATITPGTFSAASGSDYENGIGKTTFTVICNDYNGFSIYAIGYTGNSYDDTNHTKLVGSNTNVAIDTAVYSSGDTTSSWSMKVNKVTDSTISYLPTNMSIQNSFDSWHAIPDIYTKVAQYKASTGSSTTDTTLGAKIDTTYAAFIAPNQPGDTYVGQVKYVMIHPYNEGEPVYENQVGIIYEGNGLYFDQNETQTRNRVVYEQRCEDEYGYIGDTPTIMSTSNFDTNGEQTGPYYTGTYMDGSLPVNGYVEFEGASKVKLIINYGLSPGAYVDIYVDSYDVGIDTGDSSEYRSGTIVKVFEGSSVSSYIEAWSTPDPDYDYGVYVQIYPIYDEPTEGATYGITQNACQYQPVIGTYNETTTWNNYWYDKASGYTFYSEEDVVNYLVNNSSLLGTTIHFYAANSYTIVFNANGGSGTMESQEAFPYQNTRINQNTYTKPHQDVVSWTTEPDGTGLKIYASNDYYNEDKIYEPLAEAGESITLYAQWGECMRQKVCYDDNGADSSIAMRQGANSSNISLYTPKYKRQNYGFAGWNTTISGDGTTYGPNESVNVSDYNSFWRIEGIRYYAKWVPSAGNIQNWSGCPTLNVGDVTALTDIRDSNTYAVAKLSDGKCWIIENLRLGGNSPITLNTSDTETAGILPSAESSSVDYNNTISEAIYTIGNGHYYSWNVAVNTSQSFGNSVTNANSSICPSGWHMPIYSEYGSLNMALGSATSAYYYLNWRKYPNNFVFSGNTSSYISSYGYYWSSTSYSNNNAYYTAMSTSGVTTSYNATKTSTYSVRCVSNS